MSSIDTGSGSGEIVCPENLPPYGSALVAVLAFLTVFFFGFSCLLVCRERAGNPMFLQLKNATSGIHLEVGGLQAGRPNA